MTFRFYDGELLYHYTDASGLAGIVERKQLWLTDVQFLNDREELLYGAPIMERMIVERMDALRGHADMDNPEDPFRERVMILQMIRGYLLELETTTDPVHFVYATSFCEDGDLLSQWRGYAGGTGGFAIGFDREALQPVTPAEGDGPSAGLFQVGYGVEEAELLLRPIADDLATRATGHPGVQAEWETGFAVAALTVVKNPGFKEEREHRLVSQSQSQPADLRFRVGKHGLVPFRVFNFPAEAIRKVVVGPSSDTRVAAATRQLVRAHCGLDVEVVASEIPYR